MDGFSKSDLSNISSEELAAFKSIAKGLLVSSELIKRALTAGKLIEVTCEGKDAISQ